MRRNVHGAAALATTLLAAATLGAIEADPNRFTSQGPNHKRGRFKRNARRQTGRKTMPRKS